MLRFVLVLVSGILMVNALFGEKGYLATIQARQEQERVEDSLSALRAENLRLQNDAQRLRQDPSALEEAARGDLGLIKPGETLITIRDRERKDN
jgi:cell division protein FtsB